MPLADGTGQEILERKVKQAFDERNGWAPIERAPLDQDVHLVVQGDQGDPYMLQTPYRLTATGWISSGNGTPLGVTPVKWKAFRR